MGYFKKLTNKEIEDEIASIYMEMDNPIQQVQDPNILLDQILQAGNQTPQQGQELING